jgi:hypothetical protein
MGRTLRLRRARDRIGAALLLPDIIRQHFLHRPRRLGFVSGHVPLLALQLVSM